MKLHRAMYSFALNTTPYTTEVFRNIHILDPNSMDIICSKEKKEKREHLMYEHNYKDYDDNILFIKEVASEFLRIKNYAHNKDEWYMDIIRYNLDSETNPVESGLAWHCENDNQEKLITVLMYLRADKTIQDGNLGYIDSFGVKQLLMIESGTIIIMDGNVCHRPQNPTGTGTRDLIAVSFSID